MDSGHQQFEDLQRLLALKRHEVPPPGFFEAFPHRVRARILTEACSPVTPWWERLVRWRAWRPALAGACAVLTGGILVWQFGARSNPAHAPESFSVVEPPPARWAESSLTPAAASGALPGMPFRYTHWGTAPASSPAPPGLFTPGAGLRGLLVPVAATSYAPALTVTGINLSAPPRR